jgi:hypothetical protein
VGDSFPSPEDGSIFSFRNAMFSSYLLLSRTQDDGQRSRNPVSVIHRRQASSSKIFRNALAARMLHKNIHEENTVLNMVCFC